ncbi:TetR/AcrR family transcriptional regulator [Asanoa sp. WMMD1127]|uniref:TetR/AcrR family transcriptional regulator n=1 Tax=Asanoa sp. WMMD1127 TaxID=3016107 RepID=UPI002416A50D|nr:TetR/AcrR family transcriptional regulator [Asanoa sp. WMMD1127]MDG4825395.1 TetR/AcrR family transcriptional regulator [Asanoa sp. WMMD1127]
MGHREELLAGAKQCLLERGYANTTARDIVAASGTNLASIGYHFGSKEALLNAAMVEAMNDWGSEVERAVRVDPDMDRLERLEAVWSGVAASIAANPRLWFASVDVMTQTDQSPELKDRLAAAMDAGRAGFTDLVLGPGDAEDRPRVGALVLAVITGLTVQTLLDPERAPTGRELVEAIRAVVAR